MAKESKNVKNVDKTTKVEKTTKNKKSFAKDFKAELKKVIWPTSKQLVNNTIAVVVIVAVVVIFTFALDVAFEAINTNGINKIKALVTSNETLDEATVLDANTTDSTNESEESNEGTDDTVNQ